MIKKDDMKIELSKLREELKKNKKELKKIGESYPSRSV